MTSEQAKQLRALADRHAQMCADYEKMGTGQFSKIYGDYCASEGFHYITRKASELARRVHASLIDADTGEGRS